MRTFSVNGPGAAATESADAAAASAANASIVPLFIYCIFLFCVFKESWTVQSRAWCCPVSLTRIIPKVAAARRRGELYLTQRHRGTDVLILP